MKRLICFIYMTVILLSISITAFAGSVPEDLLHSDNAQIFFAEVIYYHPNKENPDIELLPVKVVKGDVTTGVKHTYYNPNVIGDFKVEDGNVYLFTYIDEHNPTDIFDVTSYDTSVLKLKNVEGDMWERFEKYLNEGRYLEAEQERLDKQNEGLPIEGETVSLVDLIGVPKEKAETVKIHYQREVYDVDVETFYHAIDGIVLTDIEDIPLVETDGERVTLTNGMYITINGFDGYAFISDDCKVDKYGMHFSRLPMGAYTMNFVDRAKIAALFAGDEYDLPFHETPLAKKIFYLSLFVVVIFAVAFTIGFLCKKKKD